MCPLLENLQEYKGLLSTFPDIIGVHKVMAVTHFILYYNDCR